MSDTINMNFYDNAQYVEHIETQNFTINIDKVETMNVSSPDGQPTPQKTPTTGTPARKTPKGKAPRLTDATYRYRWMHTDIGRLVTLYQVLTKRGLIAKDTSHEDFENLFSGQVSTARVKWLAPQAWLWYMLREMEARAYITIPDGSGIWLVASSHFLDKDGRLFDNVSFSKCKEPKKAVMALDRLVDILNAATPAPHIDIMDDDPDAELWAGIRDRGWED